jgi:hypothetical protein
MTLPGGTAGAFGLALGLLACGHGAAQPSDALVAYAAALERGDHRAAYELLSESYRRRVGYAEFSRRLSAVRADVAAGAGALREGAARAGQRVEVPLPGDERLGLVREAGVWRLQEPPFEVFSQDSPRAALRAFVRAAESARYDVLLQLAPARYRAELTEAKLRAHWEGPAAEQTRALVSSLRLALEGRIVEEGDEAFLLYGNGRQARFLREDGLWRLESPE